MEIIYTNHAEMRIKEKSLKKSWIERAMENPGIKLNNEDGSVKVWKDLKHGTVCAVYKQIGGKIIVITAYWG